MVKLGISVYPDIQRFEEIADYIRLASSYGFKLVFSSMWSVEGSGDEVVEYFRKLAATVHENGMVLDLDVNPDLFQRIGAGYDDLKIFADFGADILRMDMPYGERENEILIRNPYGILIEFNSSIIDEKFIRSLEKMDIEEGKVLACHNFFPQRYTGMKWQKYLDANRRLKKAGISTGAFVSSQNENTIGVWDAREGLCTVERMRDLPLEQQIRMMIAAGDIDTLIIGNACANEEEFREIREAVKEHIPDLNNPVIQMIMSMGVSTDREYVQKKIRVRPAEDITNAERDILFGFFPHTDVGDSSEWIWRSRMPRFLKKSIPARPYQGKEFPVGSVLMVNDNYSHYAGEVQIAMLPIINDGIRNLIGTISDTEMEILKLVRDMEIVIFLPEK